MWGICNWGAGHGIGVPDGAVFVVANRAMEMLVKLRKSGIFAWEREFHLGYQLTVGGDRVSNLLFRDTPKLGTWTRYWR